MNKTHIVVLALLSLSILAIVSCNLFPPQNSLQLAGAPYYTDIGGNIKIHFELENIGSDSLQNCKVKWYVDQTANDSIDFDEITAWAPASGVDLAPVAKSGPLTVDTTTGITFSNVEYFGVYAWGWENPPDE
jgi:hypothetical protein